MRISVTGASGFIGFRMVHYLIQNSRAHVMIVPGRSRVVALDRNERIEVVSHRNIDGFTFWDDALKKVDVVLHLAARAHVLKESSIDPLAEYRKVNVEGTLRLADQAARFGVKRFLFLSSIGVNGNTNSKPFTRENSPDPFEPYAISKLEAENGLRKVAEETGMEMVIIRPPLVYGPDAPGNFGRLVRFVQNGMPLPLGSVQNKRSYVALDNLVDLIFTCIYHPAAAGQTFLVSDGEDLSTPELIRKLAAAMGCRARLFPVNIELLRLCGYLIRKPLQMERLIGSLQIDINHTIKTLDWMPPVSVDEALQKTARVGLMPKNVREKCM